MKITVTNLILSSAAPEAVVEHNGEELVFQVSCFGRQSFYRQNPNNPQGEFDVFSQLNAYWATLPDNDQQHIFDIYREIRIAFNTINERVALTIRLNQLVIELLNFQNLDNIHHWVVFHSDVIVPSIIKSDYVDSVDRQGSRERTYIRKDYTELIALAVILRSMIPIWGEYIGQTRQEMGTLFKEFYAYPLINNSNIVFSAPMDKLRVYIEHTIGAERDNPASIIDGISSDDFPKWMLALVLIRRLCIGDIRGLDPRANMVTYIFSFIAQRMRGSNDPTPETMIKFKTYEGGGRSTDQDSSSALERYRITVDIPGGVVAELEHVMSDIRPLAKQLCKQLTDGDLDVSLRTCRALHQHDIQMPQMTLLRWVFKPIISPDGLMHLRKDLIVDALGVLESVLWARGYPVLALLSTSYAAVSETEFMMASSESRSRIPKEIIEELDVWYPYMRVSGGKRAVVKTINPAIKAIELLEDSLSSFSWTMTASDEKIAAVFGNANSRRIAVPSDIKINLANLLVEIGGRKWNNQ